MPEIFSASNRNSNRSTGNSRPSDVNNVIELPADESMISNAANDNGAISSDSNHRSSRRRHVDEYSEVMRGEQPTTNPLEAYAAKPVKVFFDSQLHDEEVILLLRRHPITQVKWVIVGVLLILVPFLFSYISFLNFLPGKYQLMALIGWYMLVAGFSLESFLSWFYNSYVITDERVIDIDFESLIYKNISAAKIDNIEDITATTGGAIQSVLDYGTVKIQTAAEKREFEFEDVPHPARITTLLNELLIEEEREKIEGRVN